jgi:hypothetical protein
MSEVKTTRERVADHLREEATNAAGIAREGRLERGGRFKKFC